MAARQAFCLGVEDKQPIEAQSDFRDVLSSPETLRDLSWEVQQGDEHVAFWNTYIGAYNSSTENGDIYTEGYSPWNATGWYTPSTPVETNSYEAMHELCAGSSPGWTGIDVIPEDNLVLLQPSVFSPICPDAQVVRVRTTTPGGYVEVELPTTSGTEYLHAAAVEGVTQIPIPHNVTLQAGANVRARQLMGGTADFRNQNNGQPHEGPWATGAVANASKSELEYLEEPSNPGYTASGLLREESIGPKFVFHCCASCEGEDSPNCSTCQEEDGGQCIKDGDGSFVPRTVTVDISLVQSTGASKVAELTLYEEDRGYFTARWNWYTEEANYVTNSPIEAWPPPPGTYRATVSDSDCGTIPEESLASFTVISDPLRFLSDYDTRAMWVWDGSNDDFNTLTDLNDRGELLQFLKAPHSEPEREINRIFFEAREYEAPSAATDDSTDGFGYKRLREVQYDPLADTTVAAGETKSPREKLQKFLTDAHNQGVAVEYLDGYALWVTDNNFEQRPKDVCERVVAFNLSATNIGQRFDGIHFDIEPHKFQDASTVGSDHPYFDLWKFEDDAGGGPDYNNDWVRRWDRILESCRYTLDTYAAQTGHVMTLTTDVGRAYEYYVQEVFRIVDQGTPDEEEIKWHAFSSSPLDYISIMHYYDSRDVQIDGTTGTAFFDGVDPGHNLINGRETVGGVNHNLRKWTEVPVLFGVETMDLDGDPATDHLDTFWDEGREAMYRILDKLIADYGADYAGGDVIGSAIHHYQPGKAYEAMPQ